MESRLQLNHFDRRAASQRRRPGRADPHRLKRIVVRPALAPCELAASAAVRRRNASSTTARAIARWDSRHSPPPISSPATIPLANPKPGTSCAQSSRPQHADGEQGGRVVSRPVEKPSRYRRSRSDNRGWPEINSQRAHRYKIGSPQASRTRPRLAPLPERERMKVGVGLQRPARSGILALVSSPSGIRCIHYNTSMSEVMTIRVDRKTKSRLKSSRRQ